MAKQPWQHIRIGIAAAGLLLLIAGPEVQSGQSLAPPGSGWLYVVDANDGANTSQILIVDPEAGRVVHRVAAGHKPDIAISPDGTRLYLAHSILPPGQDLLQGVLDVIDTATGRRLQRLENPNRWLSTVARYWSQLALSQDGRWLFQMKMAMPKPDFTSYFIDTFDTVTNEFLPQQAAVPMCVAGLLLPSPEAREKLGVLCTHTGDLRMLTLASTGAAIDAGVPSVKVAGAREHEHPGTAFFLHGRLVTGVSGNGTFVLADAASQQVLQKDAVDRVQRRIPDQPLPPGQKSADDWLAGRWIRPQPAVVSPDGGRLFLGVDALSDKAQGRQGFRAIAVLDPQTLERSTVVPLSRPASSIALSRDGRRLYAIDTDRANLSVIDAASGRELRTIAGVGTTPVFAIPAPE